MFSSWNIFTPKNISLFFPVGLAVLFLLSPAYTVQYSSYHPKRHMFRSTTWKKLLLQGKSCKSSTESAVPVLLGAQCEGALGWVCLRGLIHAQSSTGHAGSCCWSPAAHRAQREEAGMKEGLPGNRGKQAQQQAETSTLGAPVETCCIGYKIPLLLPFHGLLLVTTVSGRVKEKRSGRAGGQPPT